MLKRHDSGSYDGLMITFACLAENVSSSLLWSQAEQGATEGQDRLLGPERILGHLQSIGPMRRQLAEAGGGAFPLFLQLSESVLQLTEHVEPYDTHAHTDYCY